MIGQSIAVRVEKFTLISDVPHQTGGAAGPDRELAPVYEGALAIPISGFETEIAGALDLKDAAAFSSKNFRRLLGDQCQPTVQGHRFEIAQHVCNVTRE